MADDFDDLHRLAPAVDSARAAAAFRRRRRRTRSLRRGAMALATVAVLIAGTVAVVANLDDDAPVLVGPAEDVPAGPVSFEVLTIATASDEMGTLRSAITEGEYANLWKYANTSDPRPAVDFDAQVVVSITIPSGGCVPELTELVRDADMLTPVFVVREEACTDPLIPRTYVVAIDRSSAGASFTLRLPADDLYGFGEQRLTVVLEPGDLPTVWAQEPSESDEGMGAEVLGTLRYDEVNDCFLLDQEEAPSYPVVWPAGTTGIADGPGVALPNGQRAFGGDEVYGGGGYLFVADDFGIPDACLPDTGEVAVFNPNEDVEVNPTFGAPEPEPTCAEIEAFADSLPDRRASADYTASQSPEALLLETDLALSGTLTGVTSVRGIDGLDVDQQGYEVDVTALFKSPEDMRPADLLTIYLPMGDVEAAVPGAPVVVFAHFDDDRFGFVAAIEGFATGCSGGPLLGLVGTTGDWTTVESLDDLVSRLELAAR